TGLTRQESYSVGCFDTQLTGCRIAALSTTQTRWAERFSPFFSFAVQISRQVAPLYGRKETALLDHLIRSGQHIGRNRQADLFGCFQVDDELELLWLLNREVGRLGAFQNLVNVSCSAA